MGRAPVLSSPKPVGTLPEEPSSTGPPVSGCFFQSLRIQGSPVCLALAALVHTNTHQDFKATLPYEAEASAGAQGLPAEEPWANSPHSGLELHVHLPT